MSDHADQAEQNIETFLNSAIANARRHSPLQSDGHCVFCDEAVALNQLFCCRECRDDYDKEQRALRIAGGY